MCVRIWVCAHHPKSSSTPPPYLTHKPYNYTPYTNPLALLYYSFASYPNSESCKINLHPNTLGVLVLSLFSYSGFFGFSSFVGFFTSNLEDFSRVKYCVHLHLHLLLLSYLHLYFFFSISTSFIDSARTHNPNNWYPS